MDQGTREVRMEFRRAKYASPIVHTQARENRIAVEDQSSECSGRRMDEPEPNAKSVCITAEAGG